MHVKFGDDRLRGSGVVVGQISAFPIDFAGRPNNTLTLPCERVMPVSSLSNVLVVYEDDLSRDSESHNFLGNDVCIFSGMLKNRRGRVKPVKKGKVFPYSLPIVGPGADPGVQAVSPQVT